MNRGFTLIELILVVAIMLAVGVMGAGWYSRMIVQTEVDNTTDKIIQSLRKAQYYATVSRKSNTSGWGVNYAVGVITMYQGGTFASRNASLDERYEVNSGVTVAGLGDINFGRLRGRPGSSATITVAGGGTSRTILVNVEGRVSR